MFNGHTYVLTSWHIIFYCGALVALWDTPRAIWVSLAAWLTLYRSWHDHALEHVPRNIFWKNCLRWLRVLCVDTAPRFGCHHACSWRHLLISQSTLVLFFSYYTDNPRDGPLYGQLPPEGGREKKVFFTVSFISYWYHSLLALSLCLLAISIKLHSIRTYCSRLCSESR